MGGRRSMIVGGVSAVAAVLVVGAIVIATNATLLKDTPGSALAVAPLDLPAPSPSATRLPIAVPRPAPVLSPEVVPAPEPEDFAAPQVRPPQASAPTSSAPPRPVDPAPSVSSAPAAPAPKPTDRYAPPPSPGDPGITIPDFGSDAKRALARAREWAQAQGWDAKQVEAWIVQWRARYGDSAPSLKAPDEMRYIPETPESRLVGPEDRSSASPTPDD